ncbi:MAG: sulfotransferase [Acidimicrobiia bacterium]|nr:sulfotransferase [Acidimicrobiia bacterium]
MTSLPTFLCIGAQKGGTTSLHAYLSAHPSVFVAVQKELNFFCDREYAQGVGWYESHFEDAPGGIPRGEVSPLYTSFPSNEGVPERAARHVPEARLIYLVRDPIARITSHYRHQVSLRKEHRPLDEAVFDDWWLYIARSCYAMQIEQWMEHFERASLLIVTSEHLRSDPASALATICRHIGADVPAEAAVAARELNQRDALRQERPLVQRLRASPLQRVVRSTLPAAARQRLWQVGSRPLEPEVQGASMSTDVRLQVVEQLTPDLEKLRTYVGEDFHCWGLLDDALAG